MNDAFPTVRHYPAFEFGHGWDLDENELICLSWAEHVGLVITGDGHGIGLDADAVRGLVTQLRAWLEKTDQPSPGCARGATTP